MEIPVGGSGLKTERLSFAKIAASGLNPVAKVPNHSIDPTVDVHRSPLPVVSPSWRPDACVARTGNGADISQSEVITQSPSLPPTDAESRSHTSEGRALQNHDGTAEDFSIDMEKDQSQESERQPVSFTNAVKPPSVDGKSVASGTTFALDEKESLRPDDSASVKAAEEEESSSAPPARLPTSLVDSQDNMRAFRQQLHDIASLEPAGRAGPTPAFEFSPNPIQGVLYVPLQAPGVRPVPGTLRRDNLAVDSLAVQPDPKLLEALESPRDRIWVLKLEQDIYDFVKDPKETSLNLPQCNAYHRMLAHRIADYYMLGHAVDDSASAVRLYKTPNCRVPPPLTGITTPSTAASTPPPSAPLMKILRRGDGSVNESSAQSKTPSENGESSNDDDKKKAPASREEREARYEAARLRIMGSARPMDLPEVTKDMEDSRSSSVAGKKTKKKQRSDSEDGFEARSAYSAFYTSGYGANAFMAPAHNMQPYSEVAPAHTAMPGLSSQLGNLNYPQYGQQTSGPNQWQNHSMGHPDPQSWPAMPSPGYDLSHEFHRSMSFHGPTMTRQSSSHSTSMSPFQQGPTSQGAHLSNHQVQGNGYPLQWSPQPQASHQAVHAAQPYGFGMPNSQQYGQRPTSSSNRGLDGQIYPYGQLPSEAFPGRPTNKLEHPLPGSYKGKHFNPQSQAFIPGQPGGRPITPKGVQSPIGHGTPVAYSPLQRHPLGPSPSSGFSSHPQFVNTNMPQQQSGQPLVHPLPQPVFPRQPSPSVSLPPKPGGPLPPTRAVDQTVVTSFTSPVAAGHSTIAKWGTPASLPAKPPPSNEPLDLSRYGQVGRPSVSNVVIPARSPNLPGYPVVNGSGIPAVKHS